jgi:hypothetical protein
MGCWNALDKLYEKTSCYMEVSLPWFLHIGLFPSEQQSTSWSYSKPNNEMYHLSQWNCNSWNSSPMH